MRVCIECKTRKALSKRTICGTCKSRKYRQNNVMKYAYQTLRDNAKRRGKVFTISFEYFKQFAIRTEYLNKKGINKYSYHIDRIIEELGYVEGNLQLLQNIDNVRKYVNWVDNDENGKPMFTTKISMIDEMRIRDEKHEDCPF